MKMKNKKLITSLVVISLVLMLFGSIINTTSVNSNSNDLLNTSQEELINIDFAIHIDGNWSDYVNLYDWASGSGTEDDPWIIEGIHVTNDEKTAHISIKTAEYFIIRNVMVSEYSAYGHYRYAGIYIEKGEFGLIENCIFINCSTGLSMFEAKDEIIITNNTFIGSHNDPITGMGKAIKIGEAKGVYINNNYIYNYYDGIVVRDAEEIIIDNNRIEALHVNGTIPTISNTGVYFYGVHDSEITNNDFYGCTFDGHDYDVSTSGSSNLKTSFNNCYNITTYGNRFYDFDGNLIIDNLDDPDNESNNLMFIILTIVISFIVIGLVLYIKVYMQKKVE